jgi:ADP-heptose:LPS heptosyltransferase
VCVRRYALNLLEHCPYIDRLVTWEDLIHPLPPGRYFRGRNRLESILIRLRRATAKSFDVVLVPVRSPTRAIHQLAGSIRAAARIGIVGDHCNQSPYDEACSASVYTSHLELPIDRRLEPELEANRDFLRFLGAEIGTDDAWPEFWTDDADRRWAAEQVGGSPEEMVLGIAPGVTSMPQKRYPAERLVEAVAALRDVQLKVVLFGGPGERAACGEVAELLPKLRHVQSVVDLAGKSTVRQLVEGLRRCTVVLSEETAALHIATALRKPTVGIMGGGHFGRFYPWGDPEINRVANQPMECYGCNWKCRYTTIRCVQEIPPKLIARELQHLLTGPHATSTGLPARRG